MTQQFWKIYFDLFDKLVLVWGLVSSNPYSKLV